MGLLYLWNSHVPVFELLLAQLDHSMWLVLQRPDTFSRRMKRILPLFLSHMAGMKKVQGKLQWVEMTTDE